MGVLNEYQKNLTIFQFTLSNWLPVRNVDVSINQRINSNTFLI